jgi:hypothetical protein
MSLQPIAVTFKKFMNFRILNWGGEFFDTNEVRIEQIPIVALQDFKFGALNVYEKYGWSANGIRSMYFR